MAASKGGAGKTTLAVHLAVLASQSEPTVLVDLDDQRSATSWWQRRKTNTPRLVTAAVDQLTKVQEEAVSQGISLLIVDTAPRVETAPLSEVSSFVVIPTRPGVLDLDAVGKSIQEVASSGVRGAVVFNGCPPSRGSREASIVQEAREVLKRSPVPVAPMSLGLRASLSHALITGQAVHEYEPGGKAANELSVLWRWIKKEMTPCLKEQR